MVNRLMIELDCIYKTSKTIMQSRKPLSMTDYLINCPY